MVFETFFSTIRSTGPLSPVGKVKILKNFLCAFVGSTTMGDLKKIF